MNEGINLLNPDKERVPSTFIKRLQLIRVITIGSLFAVSVSAVILFILVALSPLSSLQAQERSLRETLQQSKKDVVMLELVKERASEIDKLVTKRNSFNQMLESIQSKLASNVTITTIQADRESVTLTVESTSLQSLNDFLNGMIGFVQEKKTFSQVTVVDLAATKDSVAYSMTVKMVLL